jgi:hypothetical protein
MPIKILDSTWFTAGNDFIGIVMTEDRLGNRKAYIKSAGGQCIENDILTICRWGAAFPMNAAYELFPHLKPENKKK